MRKGTTLAPLVEHRVTRQVPFLWLNGGLKPLREARLKSALSLDDVHEAERRLNYFSGLLMSLFPELVPSQGVIESSLNSAASLQKAVMHGGKPVGRWLIKADHALPIAGSIKARGAVYEVLLHAETLAISHGLMTAQDDRLVLASREARELFASHRVAVGSTGNLGLGIGIIAAALGFHATVHMSSDAKEWKKVRLRARGVEVVEHKGDYGAAVSAGREQALQDSRIYFVDDENSRNLFFGYSIAVLRLAEQLFLHGVEVDAEHPLFVYLPCGVGGAPGGITFGLRHLFGDYVHCFFAEPVASPCMLIRLACEDGMPISVRDVGLDNRTEADGLAVGQASEFVAPLMRSLASGVFTVPDDDLFEDLYLLEQCEGMRIEPSAAAGFRGPHWLFESEPGQKYLSNHNLLEKMEAATHILWTTGGAFVPDEEYQIFHNRGRDAFRHEDKRHSVSK